MQQALICRVLMVLEQISCPTGFVSYEHSKSTTYGNGRPSIQFSVMADAGFQLNVTNISVDIRRNPKGPTTWRLAYSLDGGTSWTNSGTDFLLKAVIVWEAQIYPGMLPIFLPLIQCW